MTALSDNLRELADLLFRDGRLDDGVELRPAACVEMNRALRLFADEAAQLERRLAAFAPILAGGDGDAAREALVEAIHSGKVAVLPPRRQPRRFTDAGGAA